MTIREAPFRNRLGPPLKGRSQPSQALWVERVGTWGS